MWIVVLSSSYIIAFLTIRLQKLFEMYSARYFLDVAPGLKMDLDSQLHFEKISQEEYNTKLFYGNKKYNPTRA